MQSSNPQLQIVPAYYSNRLDYASPKYLRFPGERPSGVCRGMNKQTCTSHTKDLGCKWIDTKVNQHYCRSPRNSVSGDIYFNQSVKLLPEGKSRQAQISQCEGLSKELCESDQKCRWIQDKNKRSYCRKAINTAQQSLFPKRYSEEEKSSWYKPSRRAFESLQTLNVSGESKSSLVSKRGGAEMPEIEQKYCRCLLQVAANDIFKYGILRKNPYGICSNSISVAAARRSGTIQSGGIRKNTSQLARSAQHGDCTENLNLNNLPTELLFVHSMMRNKTSKGRQYFSTLPTVDEFISDPESYRAMLTKQIENYRESK